MPEHSSAPLAARRIAWAAIWLAVVLVAVKVYYLGPPRIRSFSDLIVYLRSVAAISYIDVIATVAAWLVARGALALVRARDLPSQLVMAVFLVATALSCSYAVANVVVFAVFGGFITYPLLSIVGNVRMLSSSAWEYLTPGIVASLLLLPLAHVALVYGAIRVIPAASRAWSLRNALVVAVAGGWILFGRHTYATDWTSRQERRIADNPQLVLVSSWWDAVRGQDLVRMPEHFPPGDLADFASLGARPPRPAAASGRLTRSITGNVVTAAGRPPLNVVLIVLESVAARWTGLGGGAYETTPGLKTESARAVVFDNFYAHIGRSSNSLAAILLSAYPKLDFRDFTEEFPRPDRTSLTTLFRNRGYRTAFMMPSYLNWAGWEEFLQGSGFDELRDSDDMPCSPPLSSWGIEDRCMVDSMLQWIDQDAKRPFFLLGWTGQTHHPYEPSPDAPVLNLLRESTPDDYELGRYLNVLRETDSHLVRLFDTLRRTGLDSNTLVVVVGDHGQAFGYPHDSYMQGKTIYEEDVHVPLMIWSPMLYRSARRSKTIGSHVDLAPTIAELAGIPAAVDWQGRSLFDLDRPSRAYFYAAEDHFKLGVREGTWKYIFDLREGVEELYDLSRDPTERNNLAKTEPVRSARLRQRLAAWTEANRRQYEPASY